MKEMKKLIAIILALILVIPINLTAYANDDGASKEKVTTQNISLETGEAVTVKVPYYEDSYTIVNGVEPVLYTSSNSDVATAYKTGVTMSSSGSTISVEILGRTAGNADITISMRETGEVLAKYSVTVTKAATSTLRLCPNEHTTISFKYTTKNFKYKLSDSSAKMNIHKQSTSQSSINGNYQSSTSLEISFDTVGEYTLTIYDDNSSIVVEYDVIISEHSFDDGIIIKEPTCTDKGTKQYTCQKCGATTESSDEILALGHDYSEEWTIDKEPTCKEEGSKSKHCLRCGEKSEVTSIEKTDHTWNEQYTVDKEATCKEEGIESIHCSVCDTIKEDSEKSIPISDDHIWDEGVLTTDITCTEDGEKTYTCTVCGVTKKEKVVATGHVWNEEYTIDKEKTCTEDGQKSIHCTVCDAIKEDSIEIIDATGHTYGEWAITVEPTYAKEGSTERTCSKCGDVEVKEINKLTAECITISDEELELEIGEKAELSISCEPSMEKGDEDAILWSSTDENVATVEKGIVTAKNVGTTRIKATIGGKTASCEVTVKTISIRYQTHVQDYGWQDWVKNGEISGTSGKSKRLEGIRIELGGTNGSVQYRTHVQNIGWQEWKSNGEMSGTSGQSLRLEAIQIQLSGEYKEKYDIYYRVHAQSYGWLDWAKNGEEAGTSGLSKRLEAIQIMLVEKNGEAPGETNTPYVTRNIAYRTHVQNYGWQNYKYNGEMSGTSGESKRLEGIEIKLENQKYSGGIEYQTHIQNIGWQGWRGNGDVSGTSGRSLRLEAIKIRLTDEMAEHYDVYYRVHAQQFGWMGWAKNGQAAGTAGYAYRLEAIQIQLVPKGEVAPGSTNNAFVEKC